jgi:endonuclease/exonuclease/phosphatase (EEP) superfamily protein YafD
VLLFGPRWVLLLPAGVLILAVLLLDGHLLPLPILSSLIILFPVMGLQTGLGVETPPADPARDIRFVTFNARGGESLVTHPMNLIREWDADIVAVQECGRAFGRVLREMEGWNVDITSSLCLATRFEIVDVVEMEREALEFAGGSGLVVTSLLDSGSGPFFVTNLHLETPRAGFALIRAGRLWEGIPKTKEKSLLRDVELRRARKWVDQYTGAHVVVGDFNTPPESRSYRAWWSDWQNAFSEAGIGLGGTRLNGWIRARIDHILADQSWTIVESRVEQEAGSDHLPVLAVLRRNP